MNFTDEIVYFTNVPSLVQSFMRKFDDLWTSTTEFGDYANITAPLTRSYPDLRHRSRAELPARPELPQPGDRRLRAGAPADRRDDVPHHRRAAHQRDDRAGESGRARPADHRRDGIPQPRSAVGLPTTSTRCTTPGVQVRFDGHQGINHEKAILLRGTGTTIFGSSNWTSPSSDTQREHNMFTTRPWIYDWLEAQFNRKWNNETGHSETKPFVPLPPDAPVYNLPANNGTGVPTTGVLLVVLGRAVGAQLRHLLRHDAESAAARSRPAARAEPVRAPTTATTRCRRCSPARSTTGRSSRRRWPT